MRLDPLLHVGRATAAQTDVTEPAVHTPEPFNAAITTLARLFRSNEANRRVTSQRKTLLISDTKQPFVHFC